MAVVVDRPVEVRPASGTLDPEAVLVADRSHRSLIDGLDRQVGTGAAFAGELMTIDVIVYD